MSDSQIDLEKHEIMLNQALDNPIPKDLSTVISDSIKPFTANVGYKHSEVMQAIEIAYPIILKYHGVNDE
jgi:hypothetical protein